MMANKPIESWRIAHRYLGLALGARMTALTLPQGVVLYSPIPMTTTIFDQIATLGEVRWIVAPNNYHHQYLNQAAQHFSRAIIYLSAGLEKKYAHLNSAAIETAHSISNDIRVFDMRGCSALEEILLFHKPTGTLICADFIHHLPHTDGVWTAFYAKVMGFRNKPNVSKLLKLSFKKTAKCKSIVSEILGLPVKKIMPAHGVDIESNCVEIISNAYAWMLK